MRDPWVRNTEFQLPARCNTLLNKLLNILYTNEGFALVVDVLGTWYDEEPETDPGFIFQQNTMCDAFIAGIPLNYFYEMRDKIIKVKISINEKTICFFIPFLCFIT